MLTNEVENSLINEVYENLDPEEIVQEVNEPQKKENEKKRTLHLAMSSLHDLKKNLDYLIWSKKVDYKYFFTYREGSKFYLQISPKKNQIIIEQYRMAPFESLQPIGYKKLNELLSEI